MQVRDSQMGLETAERGHEKCLEHVLNIRKAIARMRRW
jgi:hypothetical protein